MDNDLAASPDPMQLETALILLLDGAEAQGYQHHAIEEVLVRILVRHASNWQLSSALLPAVWEDIRDTLAQSIGRQRDFAGNISPPSPQAE